MKKLIVMLGVTLATLGTAQAQQTPAARPADSGAYLGLGLTVGDYLEANNKTGAKLFGGYEFNKNFGIEAGYSHHRSKDFHYFWPIDPNSSYRTKGFGAYAAAKFSLPVDERFAVYGKFGLAHSRREFASSAGWDMRRSDNGVYAAVGGQAKLTENLAATLEYENYGKEKSWGAKEKQWSLGLKYGF